MSEDWIKDIKKRFGEESIRRIGDKTNIEVETVSTGSILADKALGVFGLPFGRIVEIYGPEASGKSTIALQVASNVQKNYGKVLYIDTEHSLNIKYAQALGVDVENLFLSQPNSGEEALSIAIKAAEVSEEIRCIILDSVAALSPQAELAGEIGDHTIGLQARLMSRCLRTITASLTKNKILFLCVNQIRDKIGGMGYGCIDQDSLITTENNDLIKISQISQNISIKSFSLQKKKIENKKSLSVFKNGKSKDFHRIEYISPFSSKVEELIVTSNHKVYLYELKNWCKTSNLKPNKDFLLYLNIGDQKRRNLIIENDRITIKGDKILVDNIEVEVTPYLFAKALLLFSESSLYNLNKIFLQNLSEYEKQKIAKFLVNEVENREDLQYLPALLVNNTKIKEEKERYDLEILDNSNYFANKILIHNSPETTPGGRALRFYSSVRMEIRRIGSINAKQMDLGSKVRIKITKNKFASPFQTAETEIYYGKGILKAAEALDLCETEKIVERSGSWYSYNGEKLGQGREQIINKLIEDDKLFTSLLKELEKKK